MHDSDIMRVLSVTFDLKNGKGNGSMKKNTEKIDRVFDVGSYVRSFTA